MKSLLAVILLLASSAMAGESNLIEIGKIHDYPYLLDSSMVSRVDNTVFVWIVTKDQILNTAMRSDYLVSIGRFAIDCSGRLMALTEGVVLNKKGDEIEHLKLRPAQYAYRRVKRNSIFADLYDTYCNTM